MASVYPEQQPPQPSYEAPPPKKGMSGWLIALIVVAVLVVLCCICAVIAYVVFLASAPSMGNVFSTIIETVEAATPMP